MALNRSRYIPRGNAGTQQSAGFAAALAQIADPGLLEAIVNNVAAINEHGGEVYIAAGNRQKVNAQGRIVEAHEPGAYETLGYVVAYNSRARVKGVPDEPETAYGSEQAAPVEPVYTDGDEAGYIAAGEPNGAEPEAAEVT
jgi:hypothetical protein